MEFKRYKTEEMKIWKSKTDGVYLSNMLSEDKIENYEHVGPPVFEEE